MDNLKDLLRQTLQKSRAHATALELECRTLGEYLLEGELSGSATAELKELFAKARETRELIADSQERSNRLEKLVSQLSEVRSRIDEKNGELSVLAEEIEPQYEKVGKAAVEALAGEEEDAAPYRKDIDQLIALESEMRQLNREINRGPEEERNVVTQALEGGKRLYLQGLSRTKILRAAALYRRLGKQVCDSDLIGRFDSRSFVNVLEPVLKNKEQCDKIRAQANALENKAERLESDVAALCESERAQKRLQRLEHERSKAREVFDLQLRDLGTRYADRPTDKSSMPKKVKSQLEEVVKLRKSIEALAAKRERLDAAIAIEGLDRKAEGERSRLRSLELTVKKTNTEIASLAEEIKGLNEEREKLAKVRGSLEELTGAPAEVE